MQPGAPALPRRRQSPLPATDVGVLGEKVERAARKVARYEYAWLRHRLLGTRRAALVGLSAARELRLVLRLVAADLVDMHAVVPVVGAEPLHDW